MSNHCLLKREKAGGRLTPSSATTTAAAVVLGAQIGLLATGMPIVVEGGAFSAMS